MKFNHFNIAAPAHLLAEVREFYCLVFDLTVGDRPPFSRPGFWLYANGEGVESQQAIVHLIEQDGDYLSSTQGAFHLNHLAFSVDDTALLCKKLDNLGVSYRESWVEATQVKQVFFNDPAGIGLEAVYQC